MGSTLATALPFNEMVKEGKGEKEVEKSYCDSILSSVY